jgi:hypothetical protein
MPEAIKLAEMVADQRHCLAPLPSRRKAAAGVLTWWRTSCAREVTAGVEEHLKGSRLGSIHQLLGHRRHGQNRRPTTDPLSRGAPSSRRGASGLLLGR